MNGRIDHNPALRAPVEKPPLAIEGPSAFPQASGLWTIRPLSIGKDQIVFFFCDSCRRAQRRADGRGGAKRRRKFITRTLTNMSEGNG